MEHEAFHTKLTHFSVTYFRKRVPSQMFYKVSNTSLNLYPIFYTKPAAVVLLIDLNATYESIECSKLLPS